MAWLNLILDLAALALWLNWLSGHLDPLSKTTPATLAGTLKRAEISRSKRWKFPVALAALLLARAWLYLELSAVVNWTPKLRLGFINIPFRGDLPLHMAVFTVLSFVFVLAAFYLWMLLLSAVNGTPSDANPVQRLVRHQVNWLDPWPNSSKLLCPFLLGAIAWLAIHPLLRRLAIVPGGISITKLLVQSAVVGVGNYLVWKYLLLGLLLFYFIHTHVYLGRLPFWDFVDATARNLLSPLRWLPLRVGRVDFLPLLVFLLVILLAHVIERPPEQLYRLLPF